MTDFSKAVDEPGPKAAAKRLSSNRSYILFMLCLVAVFNMLDRQIISILIEPIKEEFQASDTVMGMIVGTIFAAFYLASAIPMARLADRHPRKWVIGLCLGLWSLATMSAGFVTSLVQLGVTRAGVAVAEAAATPASHSMLADLYSIRVRATVIAVYSACASMGVGAGIVAGGMLSDLFSWRTSLVIVGSPGILLALLLLLTVREPVRGEADKLVDAQPVLSLGASLRALVRIPTYLYILLGTAFATFGGMGVLNWGPTFFRRVYKMSGMDVGVTFGSIVALALVLGSLCGGIISDRLARQDLRAYMWVAGGGVLLAIPAGLIFLFGGDPTMSLAGLFMFLFFQSFFLPPCYAMSQSLAPLRMRATASVGIGMAGGIAGIFIAPIVIGAMNDALSGSYGDEAIRYSLSMAVSLTVFGSLAAFAASRHVVADYGAVR